jgi:hypothetical protein
MAKKVYEMVVGAPREVPGLGLLEPGTIYAWPEDAPELHYFHVQTGVPLADANFTDPMVKMRVREEEDAEEETAEEPPVEEEAVEEETSEEDADEETTEEA